MFLYFGTDKLMVGLLFGPLFEAKFNMIAGHVSTHKLGIMFATEDASWQNLSYEQLLEILKSIFNSNQILIMK